MNTAGVRIHQFVEIAEGDLILRSALAALSSQVCASEFQVFLYSVPERGIALLERFENEKGGKLRKTHPSGGYCFDYSPFVSWACEIIRLKTGWLIWVDTRDFIDAILQKERQIKERELVLAIV